MSDGTALDWPNGWDRTPAHRRRLKSSFSVGLRDTIDDLEHELEEGIGVDDWRLETAAEHQKRNPKYPYADASPDDPGAVVRWSVNGDQFAVACDRWSRLRDNVREILKYLSDKRRMSNRPVETGRDEFSNARLPPGDQEMPIEAEVVPPHEVLGLSRDAPRDVVERRARQLKAEHHPDNDGCEEQFKRVVRAEGAMLDGGDH